MMMGENHSFENGPPWSPFPDGFAGVSSAGIRQMTMPVSGVSNQHGHSLTGNSFSGGDGSDGFAEALAALQRFLPSNNDDVGSGDFDDSAVDAYSCDEFRMYDFKVRRCVRGRSHDWTECPYVHPGEKARRRDPRKFHYSGTACPEFRKGSCRRGDACEFSHGVFECWLHPARYRTQPCKDGTACRRKVCFFAHTPEQLRVLPASHSPPKLAHIVAGECYDGSLLRQALAVNFDYDNLNMKMLSSPTSILAAGHGVDSPPMISPSTSPPLSPANAYAGCGFSSPRARNPVSVSDVLASMQKLHLGRSKLAPWPAPVQFSNHVSPRGLSSLRPAFSSLPSTPTAVSNWPDPWENSLISGGIAEEEPMERVESGKGVRARMFERLRKQNSGERAETASPDVGWVSELVK